MAKKNIVVTELSDEIIPFGLIAQPEIQELIEEEGINVSSPFDLPKIINPQGKSKSFEYDTPDGVQSLRELQCVVLHHQTVRAYYKDEFTGTGVPPSCSSTDCVNGFGDPGGKCVVCPLNQWGSGRDGRGKGCPERRMMFLLMPNELIPKLMMVPVTSVKDSGKYFLTLTGGGVSYSGIVTKITVETTKNPDNIEYPKFIFSAGPRLPNDLTNIIKEARQSVKELMANLSAADLAQIITDEAMNDEPITDD